MSIKKHEAGRIPLEILGYVVLKREIEANSAETAKLLVSLINDEKFFRKDDWYVAYDISERLGFSTPEFVNAFFNDDTVFAILKQYSTSPFYNKILANIAEKGSLELFIRYADETNVDLPVYLVLSKATFLHYAARGGNLPVAKWLIETKKVNINAAGDMSKTSLVDAVVGQHVDMVRYLLEQGANPDYDGWFDFNDPENKLTLLKPIEYADMKGYKEIRNILQNYYLTRRKDHLKTLGDYARIFETNYVTEELAKSVPKSAKPSPYADTAYMIFSHGKELLTGEYDDRITLPDGVWVVTREECGKTTSMGTLPLESGLFQTHLTLFEFGCGNPALAPGDEEAFRRIKKSIEANKIRVYGPGEKCPLLFFTFPLRTDHSIKRILTIYPSGIYKFPIPEKNIFEKKSLLEYQDFAGLPFSDDDNGIRDQLSKVFKYSIYPKYADVMRDYDAHKGTGLEFIDKMEQQQHFIGDIIKKLGRGVYYAMSCRSLYYEEKAAVEKIRTRSVNLQTRRTPHARRARRRTRKFSR